MDVAILSKSNYIPVSKNKYIGACEKIMRVGMPTGMCVVCVCMYVCVCRKVRELNYRI